MPLASLTSGLSPVAMPCPQASAAAGSGAVEARLESRDSDPELHHSTGAALASADAVRPEDAEHDADNAEGMGGPDGSNHVEALAQLSTANQSLMAADSRFASLHGHADRLEAELDSLRNQVCSLREETAMLSLRGCRYLQRQAAFLQEIHARPAATPNPSGLS